MGCCCSNAGAKEAKDRWFAIQDKRTFTDWICTIFYLLFLCLVIYASIRGFSDGNLENIGQPYDVDSNPCGKGKAKNYPYLFFTEFITDYKNVKGTVCVEKCLNESSVAYKCLVNSEISDCKNIKFYPTKTYFHRFCVSDLTNHKDGFLNEAKSLLTKNALSNNDIEVNSYKINSQIFKSINIPKIDSWFEDLQDAWWPILICIILAFI